MGLPVSDHLPQDVDSALQDVAQMFGVISRTDIMETKLSSKQLGNIRKYHEKLCDINDQQSDEAMALVKRIGNIVRVNRR